MEDAVTLLASLSRNLDVFRSRLNAPVNEDVIVRRFIPAWTCPTTRAGTYLRRSASRS